MDLRCESAKTPMGSRTIKKWLTRPLIDKNAIIQRQEVVSFLANQPRLLYLFEKELSNLTDLERVVGRIALHRAQLIDYLALKQSLILVPTLKKLLFDHVPLTLGTIIAEKIKEAEKILEERRRLEEEERFNQRQGSYRRYGQGGTLSRAPGSMNMGGGRVGSKYGK